MADCDDPRKARLAQALRANLKRRKAATREAPPPGRPEDAQPPPLRRD